MNTGTRASALEELQREFGARFSTSQAVRDAHGRGESFHPGAPPDAVVFVETTEDVAKIVRICADHRVPIIPFGAGTSLEGHVAALQGGVTVDLTRMNRIIAVRPTVSIAEGAPKRQDGMMHASTAPGLGVEPRMEVLGEPLLVIE